MNEREQDALAQRLMQQIEALTRELYALREDGFWRKAAENSRKQAEELLLRERAAHAATREALRREQQRSSDAEAECAALRTQVATEYVRGREHQMNAVKDADYSWKKRAEQAEARAMPAEPTQEMLREVYVAGAGDTAAAYRIYKAMYGAFTRARQKTDES